MRPIGPYDSAADRGVARGHAEDAGAIVRRRLRNQRLVGAPFPSVPDAVGWFGAVQAQDYAGAKWGVAQRTRACTDADVEGAFATGAILRTHVLRPTWHFVLPRDIRWMLALTAPRVRAACAYPNRVHGLGERTLRRAVDVVVDALRGGRHLARAELAQALKDAGVDSRGPRLGLILLRAELDAAVCSGPRRGKQFTYALLDERVPAQRALPRDEALGRLAILYFTSHGPATLEDFAWWSGLTRADARGAVRAAGERLDPGPCAETPRWRAASGGSRSGGARRAEPRPTAHLLANYDEYLVAYKDRSAFVDDDRRAGFGPRPSVPMNPCVLVGGRVAGGWRRVPGAPGREVHVEVHLVSPLPGRAASALRAAVLRYGRYLGATARLTQRRG